MDVVTQNWTDLDTGNHDGGVSYGEGFCISWQRGPLKEAGRNGAFLIDVLGACRSQLQHYQSGKFACDENQSALEHLDQAILNLESRLNRREQEGKLGTTEV